MKTKDEIIEQVSALLAIKASIKPNTTEEQILGVCLSEGLCFLGWVLDDSGKMEPPEQLIKKARNLVRLEDESQEVKSVDRVQKPIGKKEKEIAKEEIKRMLKNLGVEADVEVIVKDKPKEVARIKNFLKDQKDIEAFAKEFNTPNIKRTDEYQRLILTLNTHS